MLVQGIRALAPVVLLFAIFAAAHVTSAQTTVYAESFENSATFSSWTITSTYTANLWHRTSNAGNPNFCLGYCQAETPNSSTPNGNYSTTIPNMGTAASPAITLTGGTYYALSLDFYHKGENAAAKDILSIGIGTTPYLADTVLYSSGLTHSYSREAYNISSFAGQTIYIVFKFDTVDQNLNSNPGTRIDNILVEASTSTAPVLSAPTTLSAACPVLITEVAQDPGPTGDEYIELTNVSNAAVNIVGWSIVVYATPTSIAVNHAISGSTLNPSGTWVFADVTSQTYTSQSEYIGTNIGLFQNYGIALFDSSSTMIDFVCFGSFNASAVTSPATVGSHWSGAGATNPATVDNSSKRSGSSDSDDASDWSTTTGDTLCAVNSGLNLPFAGGASVAIGGTDPAFTGDCVVNDSLGIVFEALDPQAYNTVAITVSVTGGSLTAAQAGFSQTFPYQVSGYPGAVTATLSGTATTDGTIQLTVVASDGTNTDSYTYALTIDPLPPSEIDIQNSTSTSIASGGTDTLTAAIPVGFPENIAYTIENQDTGDLELTGAPAVAYANNQNCSVSVNQPTLTTIAGYSSTMFDLDVTPAAAGAWSVQISIDNNDSNEDPYTFTISGTAYVPDPEMDVQRGGTSIAVGTNDIVAGTQSGNYMLLTYAIQNLDFGTLTLTGSPAVVISGQTNCAAAVGMQPASSIGANGNSTCDVDLTPATPGAWSFVVTINNNDSNENPYTFTVNGAAQGTPAPEINLQRPAGTSIAVGATDTVGGTVMAVATPLNYRIENLGSLDLDIPNSVQITNLNNCTAMLVQAPSTPVASGNSTSFSIEVTPAAAGAWSFDASIDNNDSNENPYTWVVSGTAQASPAPEIDVQRPQGVSIASGGTDTGLNGVAGTPFSLDYTIENQGSLDLNLTGNPAVAVTGATNCTAVVSIQPSTPVTTGNVTSFTVEITPVAGGTFSFSVSIDNDDASENPYTFIGDGAAQAAPAPEMDVQYSGSSIAVGTNRNLANTTAGVAISLDFTIENQGNADLNLSANPPVQLSGLVNCNAVVSSQPGSPVGPAASTAFIVDATPSTTGAWSFNIAIPNDDANENPYTFTISGNAQPAPTPEIEVRREGSVAIPSGTADSRPGFNGTQSVRYTIHNFGTAPLDISSVNLTAMVDCTATVIAQPTQPIAVNAVGVLDIEVQPPDNGSFSFIASITNDDPDENPYTFNFEGSTFSNIEFGDKKKKDDEACSANPAGQFAWLLLGALPIALERLRRRAN